jgi:tetratricopeptide (TPR) repeat protein
MKDYVSGKNTLKSLQSTLATNPNDIEANLRMGKKLFESGNNADARKHFENVTKLDSDNKSGWTDDAELYLAQMNGKKEDIDSFIKKYPDSELTKQALLFLAESTMENNDYATGDKYYEELIAKYGKNDEDVSFSYGQFLLSRIYGITKNENISKSDNMKGIELANTCLEYVRGSINEASCYYYLSILNFNLGNKSAANEFIDKAINIFDRKSFREFKEKINK